MIDVNSVMGDLHTTSLATLKIPGPRSFGILPIGVALLSLSGVSLVALFEAGGRGFLPNAPNRCIPEITRPVRPRWAPPPVAQ